MEIIIHRINTIKQLKKIPINFGIEIDIRSHKDKIILNHEPYKDGDLLINYIENYQNGTLILNIKESGIEKDVLEIVKNSKKVKNFFLLDIEIPYIFQCIKEKEKNFAVRVSSYEPINGITEFKNKFKWIWIDTIKNFNFSNNDLKKIIPYKKCLVCPERWGKPENIKKTYNYFKRRNIKIDAVMTSMKYSQRWIEISN